MELSFLVVDENDLDCFIAEKVIEQTNNRYQVKSVQNPVFAFELVEKDMLEHDGRITVILLDLKMPLMSGFEFVEEFEKLPVAIQQKYSIIILSSTLNRADISKVLSHKAVSSRIEKPITKAKLTSAIAGLNAKFFKN